MESQIENYNQINYKIENFHQKDNNSNKYIEDYNHIHNNNIQHPLNDVNPLNNLNFPITNEFNNKKYILTHFLISAAKKGDLKLLKKLIEEHMDVNST